MLALAGMLGRLMRRLLGWVWPALARPSVRAALRATLGAAALWPLWPLCAPPPVAAQPPSAASPQAWAAAAALSRGVAITDGPAAPAADGEDADDRLVSAVAQAGWRSVQLAWTTPAGAMLGEAALQRLDRLVDAFLARGVAVVLHDRDPAGEACGGVADRPVRPAPSALASAWQALARRHAGRPARLMFMLSVASLASADAERANRQLWPLLRAIRASNPRRPVVIAWGDAINLPRLQLPPDPHLLVAVVNREPERFSFQGVAGWPDSQAWLGASCCSPREAYLMDLPLDLAQAWSARHRVPVWVNGFGAVASAPPAARARHARLMRESAEARALPWAYCAWDGAFGVRAGSAEAQRTLHDALQGH
jgi:hypothetical protein